jgi:hypothetical protein
MKINPRLLEKSSGPIGGTIQISPPNDDRPFPTASIVKKEMEATHAGRKRPQHIAEPSSTTEPDTTTRYIIFTVKVKRRSSELWKQLEKLRDLSKDWDTYKADPPNDFALDRAKEILSILIESDFPPTRIMASVEGGVGFVFTHKDKYGDIECLNSQEIVAVIYDRKTEPDAWSVALDSQSIRLAINKIRSFLNA